MQRFFDVVQDRSGNCIPNALVYVYVDSTSTLATLYSDNGVTTTPNPVTTNSDGEYAFYAANGTYTLQIQATGYDSQSRPGTILFDPANGGALVASNVAFTQTGSSFIRTVQAKLEESVSVKDFGALGNGSTDDRAAINLALASGAKAVYFPAGTYRISAQIEIFASGVNAWSDAGAVIKPIDSTATGFTVVSVRGSNTIIDGLLIDGNTAAPPLSGEHFGIALNPNGGTLTNVDIINCTIQNFTGYGVYSFSVGTLTNVNILNSTFINFTSVAATPPGAVQLVTPTSSDIRVVDCYFKNLTGAGFAVRSDFGNAYVTNVTLSGCVFENNNFLYTSIGAEIWKPNNLSVTGCTFRNGEMGLSIVKPLSKYVGISGNTFDNHVFASLEIGEAVSVSISGNSFNNFERAIIHYDGARDVAIDGNTFTNALPGATSSLNRGWGVEQSGTGGATDYEQFVVSNNTFYNCSGVNLYQANTNIVEGNIFETTSANNLCRIAMLDSLSKRCILSDNIFRTSVNIGAFNGFLSFTGSDHLITNNSFISTTGAVNTGAGISDASFPPGSFITNVFIVGTYANNFTYGIYAGTTTTNVKIANTETVNCTTAVQVASGAENFYGFAKSGYQVFGDSDVTLDGRYGGVVESGGTLTANRTITLSNIGVTAGTQYTIHRIAPGDFTLNVGGLITLNRFESCVVMWDGVAWRLTNYNPQSFRTIYQNSRSANYTAVLADSGKQIFHPAADNNPRTFTIPANSSVGYPIGTELMFVNMINTVTIAITTDTLTQAGTGATGSRTLAANGWARAVKITSTQWLIDGTGLT